MSDIKLSPATTSDLQLIKNDITQTITQAPLKWITIAEEGLTYEQWIQRTIERERASGFAAETGTVFVLEQDVIFPNRPRSMALRYVRRILPGAELVTSTRDRYSAMTKQ